MNGAPWRDIIEESYPVQFKSSKMQNKKECEERIFLHARMSVHVYVGKEGIYVSEIQFSERKVKHYSAIKELLFGENMHHHRVFYASIQILFWFQSDF